MTDTPPAEHIREIVRTELAPMRAQLDGLPLINRTVTAIQQEVRSLREAFHDFALTDPTSGEIEALHTDVNVCRPRTRSSPRA
jgi:hypothetical protein